MYHRYTSGGAPIAANMPVSHDSGGREHRQKFGLMQGWVKQVVYPDDPENLTGELEYIVSISGQDYHGVLDISRAGGIYANHVRIRKGSSLDLKQTPSVVPYEEEQNGERVWVLFIGGSADIPIIVGSGRHPRIKDNQDYKDPSSAEGDFERYEFNGLEFLIDKEGGLSIKQIGNKDHQTHVPKNPDAIGAEISFKSDGSTTVKTAIGTEILVDAGDLISMKTSVGSQITIDGPGDIIGISANFGDELSISAENGIQASTPSGTSLSMKDGEVVINGTDAQFVAKGGKVAIGGPDGEICDVIDQCIDVIDGTLTGIQQITVPTAVGPSGVPTNSATFVDLASTLADIKAVLGKIKGTL